MNDIQMTQGGDIYFNKNFDIQVTDSVAQAVRIRLRWFFAEWRFAPKRGVKYFQYVFVKRPNRQLVVSLVKSVITEVEGISSVDNVSMEINNRTRRAVLKFTAKLDTGQRYTDEVDIESLITGE